MRFFLRYWQISFCFLLFIITSKVQATHIRAGEITARRLSLTSPTYEIKLTAYFDIVNGTTAAERQDFAEFTIGNVNSTGASVVLRAPRILPIVNIGNNSTRNVYIIQYTFPGTGQYRISFEEDNRNNNVLNIGPKPTQNLNFYVSTTLNINSNLGLNQTPVLLNAPIDLAAVGQRYIHNPGAFDADGDSLSYKMFIPQRSGVNGSGINLEYDDPNLIGAPGNTETGATPATFSLNSVTGDIIWDAPMQTGYYNIAFVVEEWRDGFLIGRIVRDMQIIVEDARNDRPVINPLDDICVEAGTRISQPVTATDKNGDRLTLTSTGGVYDPTLVKPANATFTVPQQGTLGQVAGTFTWQTGCDHVRLEPYSVLFKVEDAAASGNAALFRKLVDMTTLNIRVFGPKPTNLTAVATTDPAGIAYRLNWNTYQCQIPGARIAIYRSEGCKEIPEDVCISGIPAGSGYERIGQVAINQTTYLDNQTGLKAGVSYSYRIVVEFPRPGANINEPGYLVGGGESIASEMACLEVPTIMPVITHVTVDQTSQTAGEITVRWTRPMSRAGVPAQYKLMRATGQTGTNFTTIATISTNLDPAVADTLFVDKLLNTTDNAYRYQLEYSTTQAGSLAIVDVTEPASSVRLEQGAAIPTSIRLNWSALVPWNNNGTVHRIYREDKDNPGTFNRIDDITTQGGQPFTYIDDGIDKFPADGTINVTISKETSYCYKVETLGSYNDRQIKPDNLLNFSQIICLTASDTTRPCPPVLVIDPLDCAELNKTPEIFCNQNSFTNNLSWTYPQECDQNLNAYRVYYARYEGDTPALVGTVTAPPIPLSTLFAHNGLTSFAGCYYVTAVNSFGVESAPSNIVCKDNCPMYVLPNVFTPNGDNKNDIFKPFDCPAFVQSVECKIFNRWGTQVYETKDVNINWDGKTNAGKELAAGQYYYEVSVTFESATRNPKPTIIKGWVQIVR
ncbi:gliding motility-associated C-terminal domain-containing protein [Dyadobacter luteus]|uniref:Gliding motility-associated C-terminal domain-containing protein n=1 Tax=Dyadobacter luteus TaxID=2259619 RepID=A0A3D8Y9X9_9BACT|nr:gliding motility-associated C-terminal domain-containing protein [Dyadobacter luteus]REA60347.1 gliding motility-associated C-terminal domain-containing protein [Dyadobacter luteus]